MAPVTEVETTGWSETRPTPADLADGAVGGTRATQTGSSVKATQADTAMQSRLLWLATGAESETEPGDLYSQGDQPDPHKDRWELAVGGAVSGIQYLVSPPPTAGPLGARRRVLY